MKKILVTWWAWFIWSNLCRKLLSQWHEVSCLDNLSTGSRDNIVDMLDNDRFNFIDHDVTIPFSWNFDQIYHLACPASPVHYQKNPIKTTKTSVIWSINMLELSLKTNASILYTSTSEVYWDPKVHPQNESYWWNVNPIWVRSCYDEWKRCAESLFMDYNREYGIDIKIVRIFNTYWPGMLVDDWRVISNFITQALKGVDITIYWEGKQTRSFQYIDDLLEGIIKIMNSEKSFLWPVNLWSNKEITINELSEKILDLIPDSKSNIVYSQLPKDDPEKRRPDTSLAFKKFWWKADTSLEKWLNSTIKYFRSII